MGRQAYITRLALGRSAFEPPPAPPDDGPTVRENEIRNALAARREDRSSTHRWIQEYDARGHPINPMSRIMGRISRLAQNDVLSTVGVCVATRYSNNPGDGGSENRNNFQSARERIDSIMLENEIGLILKTLDLALLFVATWWIAGIRHRLCAFQLSPEFSLRGSLKTEFAEKGFVALFLTGLPVTFLFIALKVGKDVVLAQVQSWAYRFLVSDDSPREQRILKPHSLIFLEKAWVDLYLWGIIVKGFIVESLYQMIRSAAPKPGNPDFLSVRAASEGELDDEAIPGIGSADYSRTTLDGLRTEEPMDLSSAFQEIRHSLGGLFAPRSLRERLRDMARRVTDTVSRRGPSNTASDVIDRGEEEVGTGPVVSRSDGRDGAPQGSSTTTGNNNPVPFPNPESYSNHTVDHDPDSPTDTASASASSGESETRTRGLPGIQLANRRHDNDDTVTMEVEISGIPPIFRGNQPSVSQRFREPQQHAETQEQGQQLGERPQFPVPSPPTQFEAGRREPVYGNEEGDQDVEDDSDEHDDYRNARRGPEHRVTCLSSFPIDSASAHTSTFLANCLSIPWETALVRAVAISYYAAAANNHLNSSSSSSSLSSSAPHGGIMRVATTTGPDGFGSWGSRARYLTGLAMLAGMEMVVSFSLFEVGYYGVREWGKRHFAWGRL
ncbi:MAG: hypothetical protein M1837_006817 [Sclerophora amabilis]|nr:MAG: hypothetical protein M1837_006817 [Sclerophora amabilis]